MASNGMGIRRNRLWGVYWVYLVYLLIILIHYSLISERDWILEYLGCYKYITDGHLQPREASAGGVVVRSHSQHRGKVSHGVI